MFLAYLRILSVKYIFLILWTVRRSICLSQVSAAGFFASMEFPVDKIDSPDFHPDAPWALRCLFMCFHIMLFRFRFVRTHVPIACPWWSCLEG